MSILISRQQPWSGRFPFAFPFAMVVAAATTSFSCRAAADVPSASPAGPASQPARGPNPRDEFGHSGQLVVTGAAQVNIEASTETSPDAQVLFAPSADLFVAEGFSIGATFTFQRQLEPLIRPGAQQAESPAFALVYQDADTLGAGIRFGYDVRFAPSWSFWPTASVAWQHTWFEGESLVATAADDLSFGLFAPFLLHPAPHFFVGLGPAVDVGLATTLSSPSSAVEYGLRLTVGGWVDLHGRNPS